MFSFNNYSTSSTFTSFHWPNDSGMGKLRKKAVVSIFYSRRIKSCSGVCVQCTMMSVYRIVLQIFNGPSTKFRTACLIALQCSWGKFHGSHNT